MIPPPPQAPAAPRWPSVPGTAAAPRRAPPATEGPPCASCGERPWPMGTHHFNGHFIILIWIYITDWLEIECEWTESDMVLEPVNFWFMCPWKGVPSEIGHRYLKIAILIRKQIISIVLWGGPMFGQIRIIYREQRWVLHLLSGTNSVTHGGWAEREVIDWNWCETYKNWRSSAHPFKDAPWD